MAVNWPGGVTTKAYSMSVAPANNVEEVTFESGMKRSYQKDLRGRITATLSFMLTDDGEDSPYRRFVRWWDEVLLSRARTFYFPDLITHDRITEYRATSDYTSRGQLQKEVTFSVEEA